MTTPLPKGQGSRAKLVKPRKLVYGVGVNDADYAVAEFVTVGYVGGKRKQKKVWACPYYGVWADMLKRCYSTKYQEGSPTYVGCTVAVKWLKFSNFKAWMEKQDFECKQLDKDLLFEGNKVYAPDTCVFVTQMVNSFTNDQGARRGERLIGMHWNKEKSKFQVQCCNPFTKKQEHLGYFICEQEAHQAWRKRKDELAHELAAIQTDPRIAEALRKRYSNRPALLLT